MVLPEPRKPEISVTGMGGGEVGGGAENACVSRNRMDRLRGRRKMVLMVGGRLLCGLEVKLSDENGVEGGKRLKYDR